MTKLMVIGHARHGKDTVCEILRDLFGFTFVSSSWFLAEKVVEPYLAKRGIQYPTLEACYNDRAQHRAAWHDAIAEFNGPDPARLGRMLFAQYDIYCGMRSELEFNALKFEGAFDAAIWVDRSRHLPPEPYDSMKLSHYHADVIVNNNGPLVELLPNVQRAMRLLHIEKQT